MLPAVIKCQSLLLFLMTLHIRVPQCTYTLFTIFRYKILLSCWEEDPDERPKFSELASTIAMMLEGIAGYMPLQLYTLSAYGEPSGDMECSDDTAATDGETSGN